MPRLPKGEGRKKTATEKIEDQRRLEVTFCKRRYGIFKKAAELCILCGCHVAVILSSVKKKLYSFGHTSAELVSRRFIYGGPHQQHRLNQQLSEIRLDEDSELNEVIVEDPDNNCRYWWLLQQKGVTMSLEELENMEANACEFKSYLCSPHTQEESAGPFSSGELFLTPDEEDLFSSFFNSEF